MLSKNKIAFLHSLKLKKFRDMNKLFLAEGSKLILDLLNSSFEVKEIYASGSWINGHERFFASHIPVIEITEAEMERITALSSPSPVLAVVAIREQEKSFVLGGDQLTLVLDDIKDPGNLGTIIRIADWYGIETIVCSEHSVELYNPKVIQATMGSVARVKVHYTDLKTFFEGLAQLVPVYGTFLEGESIYRKELNNNAILVIGNESNGISPGIENFITERLVIPSFRHQDKNSGSAESLNVSMATAIACSEFRRQMDQRKP